MSKPVLRRELRAARTRFVEALGPERRRTAEQAICMQVHARLAAVRPLAAYLATGAEPDLAALFPRIAPLGLPQVDPDGTAMRFLRWSPSEPLVLGPFGVRQPAPHATEIAPAAILAPLVGFDRRGGRLGQGGGFYDRAFAAFPDALRIGIAWSVQEHAGLPLDGWDIPLHAIATEAEWITIP